jgi:LCP family protein required for cell wall assembly
MSTDKNNSDGRFDERELRSLLSEQIQEQMYQSAEDEDDSTDFHSSLQEVASTRVSRQPIKKKKKRTGLKVTLIVLMVLLAGIALLIGTKPGRQVIYTAAGNYVFQGVTRNEEAIAVMNQHNDGDIVGRKEEGVNNYLIYGIEEIGGAKNTDSMMIATVNYNNNSIKLTSLMRDSYVEVPGWKSTKLNAAYAKGGASLLIDTIETNFKIHIDGYASVNFESFEKIVDSIGKVKIELGKKEAKYLRTTNYISNPEYRTVKAGVNYMNGNQVLGYCRVRKVETLGGVNNDYGRTLRQRRALSAIFDKAKSLNIFKMFSTANECMGYINTSLSSDQIRDIIELVVEEKITKMETLRLPADGMFSDPKSYEGTTYPLVYDWDENINELYNFVYGGQN